MDNYKCPSCGGYMEFSSKTQCMKCPFCGKEISVDEIEEENEKKDKVWDDSDMNLYVCESCGGEIVADETTGATTCPYCDNRVVMKGKFSGDKKPDYIIPFKLDNKKAKEAYKKHLEGKIFLPKIFKSENHIDEIKGVYVPFWLFDIDLDGDLEFRAEKERKYTRGNTEYTEIEEFSAQRAGSMSFSKIPEDGSSKMDDDLMESVEPYQFSEAVEFKKAYMAGYMADRYDVDAKDRLGRAKSRAEESLRESFRESVKGYTRVEEGRGSINMKNSSYEYALYPVWILNTSWRDNNYVFAMNGQTGKLVGNLPSDKTLVVKYVAIRGGILGALIYLLMFIYSMI